MCGRSRTWWKRVVCRSGGFSSEVVYEIPTEKPTQKDTLKTVIECCHYDIRMCKLNSTLEEKVKTLQQAVKFLTKKKLQQYL